MKELIESIKNKVELIESALDSIPKEQQEDLSIRLHRVDKDLRGIILYQMALNR